MPHRFSPLTLASTFAAARSAAILLSAPAFALLIVAVATRTLSVAELAKYFLMISSLPILGEFVGLGSTDVAVKRISRDQRSYAYAVFDSMFWILVSVLPIGVAYATLYWIIFPETAIWIFLLLGLLDLGGGRICTLAENVELGFGKRTWADLIRFSGIGLRASSVVVAALYGGTTAATLALASALGIAAAALIFSCLCLYRRGPPRCSGSTSKGISLSFTLNNVSRASQQNLDRFLLAFILPTPEYTSYSVVSRIVVVGMIPIAVILRNNYSSFFRHGETGIAKALAFGTSVAGQFAAASMISAVAVYLFAPYAGLLFGELPRDATTLLQTLALIYPMYAAFYLAADILSGADRQVIRGLIVASAVVVQSSVQAYLASIFGLSGLAVGWYLSLAVMIIAAWSAVLILQKAEQRHD